MSTRFGTGMDVLLEERRDLIRHRRIGLVTHPAALTVRGQWSADLLWDEPDLTLACLLGPEHGLFGQTGAGEPVASAEHPAWRIPMHSLYGTQRKPTPEMLDGLDVILVDLQDLGVRCYTFVSTLFLVLEAAAELSIPVVVTDRPIPFPDVVDGPMRDAQFQSFVAQNELPLVYGMSQGECALCLSIAQGWHVDLQVIPMRQYRRGGARPEGAPPWVPPSTGIRSWESAWCYPATVWTEALLALDCDRTGPLPFQVLGVSWMKGNVVARALADRRLPGVRIFPHTYYIRSTRNATLVEGIRFVVTDPAAFRPVQTGLTALEILQNEYGHEPVWRNARTDFFDQLFGTDKVRKHLQAGGPVTELFARWHQESSGFIDLRSRCMLYG